MAIVAPIEGSPGAGPAPALAATLCQTLLITSLLGLVVAALVFGLGRQGERIATQMCVHIAAILSLAVFSGNSGIVSFGHAAFLALGAYLSGLLTMAAGLQGSTLPMLPGFLAGHELSLPVSLVVVAAFGALVAALIGVPITRLAGASATIATLGVLIIVHGVLIGARDITRGSQTFYGVPRITDLTVALAAAVAFVVVAKLYRESRHGLALRAARDDETAAGGIGIDARRARLIAWTLSGAMATLAGALYGHMLGAFSPKDFYFSLTFTLVAMLIVGGMSTVGGAVAGVVVVTLLQDGVRQFEGGMDLGIVQVPAVYGLTTASVALLILVVLWRRPEGLLGVRELEWPALTRLLGRVLPSEHVGTGSAPHATGTPPVKHGDSGAGGIEIDALVRRFGGLVAVDGASFHAPGGKITGLIGPNGAGKSTIVNLLTGQFSPDSGRIRFDGHDLAGRAPHALPRLGLARTFQNIRLFEHLSVRENVLVAALACGASRGEAAGIASRALQRLDLAARADLAAGELPYGERKRLEIARCLALQPRFLLLDEPAAGLNPEETSALAERLHALCAEHGIGMLLIDHDLDFVNRLSSSIVVVDRGRVIAVGTPEAIRTDPKVMQAYLGRSRRPATGPVADRSSPDGEACPQPLT